MAVSATPDARLHYRKLSTISIAGAGRFIDELRGLTCDSADRLYAAGDSHVSVLGEDARRAGLEAGENQNLRWRVLATWKTETPAHAVALGADGAVYVGGEGEIEVFEPLVFGEAVDSAKKGGVAGPPARRAVWRDRERLVLVSAVAALPDGVLAADVAGRCVRRLDAAGRWLSDIGNTGKLRGLAVPNGHVDFVVERARGGDGASGAGGADVVYVLNPGIHRVERYSLAGELLGHWGRFDGRDPEGFGGCCNPTNVALLPGGDLVVTEKAGPRVKVYTRAGKLRAAWGAADFDPACKNMAVAADGRGRIYVVHTERLHIVVYEPVTAREPDAAGKPADSPQRTRGNAEETSR